MISPNGIAHIQLQIRTLVAMIFSTLTLTGCADEGYDANRMHYAVSAETVQVSDVELAIRSCLLPNGCDFIFEITNRSDRCIAIDETSLPSGETVWLDTTLNNVPRQISGVPVPRVRYTYVVLAPGETVSDSVDVRAISGLRDLRNSTIIMTTHFFECSAFSGAPSQSFELVSSDITFREHQ
jgi:hypothetical protein